MALPRAGMAVMALGMMVALASPYAPQVTDGEEVSIGQQLLAGLAASRRVSVAPESGTAARLRRLAERVVRVAGRPGLGWPGGWQWVAARFAQWHVQHIVGSAISLSEAKFLGVRRADRIGLAKPLRYLVYYGRFLRDAKRACLEVGVENLPGLPQFAVC